MPVTKGQGNPDWTVDETILALDLLLRQGKRVPGENSQEVIELSNALRRLPIHSPSTRKPNFRNPAGVALKLQNLLAASAGELGRPGLSACKTDMAVWGAYAHRPAEVRELASAILAGAKRLAEEFSSEGYQDLDDDPGILEGSILPRLHRIRERKVKREMLLAKRRNAGKLCCDACCFDPRLKGTAIEAAEFEIHHLLPLHQTGQRNTRPTDLALLCANCHRLIHALMRSTGLHKTVADVQKMLASSGPKST